MLLGRFHCKPQVLWIRSKTRLASLNKFFRNYSQISQYLLTHSCGGWSDSVKATLACTFQKRGCIQPSFKIIQGVQNAEILYKIQGILNMGRIYNQSPTVLDLRIEKRPHLRLIVLLFNSKLVLPSRQIQFNSFLSAFNSKSKRGDNLIVYKSIPDFTRLCPSLDQSNPWLLGFSEAEGSFFISFKKKIALMYNFRSVKRA
jgi:hypothetical protein